MEHWGIGQDRPLLCWKQYYNKAEGLGLLCWKQSYKAEELGLAQIKT